MIGNIDVEAIRVPLEQYASEVVDTPDDRLSSTYMNDAFWLSNKIELISAPTSWRIIKRSDEKTLEEAVLSIHGVLTAKDLPPVTEAPKVAKNRFRFLRQSVSLAGLGTPTFQQALLAIDDFHQRFDRTFAEGLLETWTRADLDDPLSDIIELSNRYFTPINEAQGLESKEFVPGVDPLGILQDIVRASPTSQYTPCEPQSFRIGDIVKAQMSFVVIPMKGGKRKMLAILRSLTLIDSRFGPLNVPKLEKTRMAKLASVKRRIGYSNIDPAQSGNPGSQKQARMEVDT